VPYAAPMLLGRDRELAQLGHMLDEARSGPSSTVIVHGEPGIGKTALVDAVARTASGFTVLNARPLEAESELPFAGLADLLRPLLGLLDRIPPPQAAVLSGALAIGPATPGDRFAAAAATISLLAAGGDVAAVLAVVDDAQWLDTPSREALLFAARRLGSERVVLLFAMRDRPWRTTARIDGLELVGLGTDAAVALVARSGKVVSPAIRDRLVGETAGNPLAITEALANLRDDQLAGSVPIAGPIAVGANLEASFARRLEPLPERTRRALLVAAVSDTGDFGEIATTLGGEDSALIDLAPAERLGLVGIRSGSVEFVHPLLRSAAYHGADPTDRRWAHRTLAGALGPDRQDQTAWHLAAAATGLNEAVARRLEETAAGAQARHGYIAAANAMAAAARLSPTSEDRVRRTIGAGTAFRLGGQAHAANDLLLGLLADVSDPLLRADVQLVRGSALVMIAPAMDSTALLVEEAGRVEPHDPARAAYMLVTSSVGAVAASEIPLAVDVASRAVTVAQTVGGPVTMVADLAQAAATGIGWAAAVAARGRGLLAAEERYPDDFAQAIELHGDHDLYELGRTLLCFGRRLRHSRRRAQARTQLRRALNAFAAVGAQLWAEQTRAELRVTGETTTAPPAGPTVSLTPQELHVALRVAGGATNKEAAAGLFISAKTVEFHLGNIYQKLGLRSRTELTRRMSEASNGLPRAANDT